MSYPVYKPELVNQIADMFADGSSITKVCAFKLGVTRKTYYEWKEKHPDFREQAERGEQISEALHEEKLEAGADGEIENYNAASRIFIMKSRFRETYGEKKDVHITTGAITDIIASHNDQND